MKQRVMAIYMTDFLSLYPLTCVFDVDVYFLDFGLPDFGFSSIDFLFPICNSLGSSV